MPGKKKYQCLHPPVTLYAERLGIGADANRVLFILKCKCDRDLCRLRQVLRRCRHLPAGEDFLPADQPRVAGVARTELE